jgi:RNA polymerase sigma-70 factor, ECF subfamily
MKSREAWNTLKKKPFFFNILNNLRGSKKSLSVSPFSNDLLIGTFMEFSSDLIAGLRSRDETAFRHLYDGTKTMLLNFIMLKTGGERERAEDILADVYCDAVRYSASLLLTHNVKAWLFRIARSKIGDHYRRKIRESRLIRIATGEMKEREWANLLSNTPETELLLKERGLLLKAAFSLLPEENRTVLTKRYVEEKSLEEIGALLGKGGKAVENIIYRAKRLFRDEVMRLSKEKIYGTEES